MRKVGRKREEEELGWPWSRAGIGKGPEGARGEQRGALGSELEGLGVFTGGLGTLCVLPSVPGRRIVPAGAELGGRATALRPPGGAGTRNPTGNWDYCGFRVPLGTCGQGLATAQHEVSPLAVSKQLWIIITIFF